MWPAAPPSLVEDRGGLVKANDVLPGGGAAEVSYVFGYKSKTLIQVIVD